MDAVRKLFQNQRPLWLPFVLVAMLAFAFAAAQRPKYDVAQVTIPEAKALFDAGAVVVDVRGEEAYHNRHIPGALSVPLAVLQMGVPAILAHAQAKSILVYCGDGVTIGPEGTHLLNQAGYPKAVNLKDGLQGWANAGMPIAK